jgi:hypothetical protein
MLTAILFHLAEAERLLRSRRALPGSPAHDAGDVANAAVYLAAATLLPAIIFSYSFTARRAA